MQYLSSLRALGDAKRDLYVKIYRVTSDYYLGNGILGFANCER